MTVPRMSVVIVSWNTGESLIRCLEALRRESSHVPLEVIVVDNASEDRSADRVRGAFPEVAVIANPDNRGFAAAANQGLARARAPLRAVLNPDTEVLPGALAELAGALETHPDAAVAGPQLLHADGTLQASGRRFPTLARTLADGLLPAAWRQSRGWRRRVFGRVDFSRPAWVDEVSGACFAARAETWARIGGFDERFFMYFEEVDWFRRLAAAGGKVLYWPAARILHQAGESTRQASCQGVAYHGWALIAYWQKWGGLPGSAAARLVAALHALVWGLAGLWRGGRAGRDRAGYAQPQMAGCLWRCALGPLPRAYRPRRPPVEPESETP